MVRRTQVLQHRSKRRHDVLLHVLVLELDVGGILKVLEGFRMDLRGSVVGDGVLLNPFIPGQPVVLQ